MSCKAMAAALAPLALALILVPALCRQAPKGKVVARFEDHFAGVWGWIEDDDQGRWLILGGGRVRVPYQGDALGLGLDPNDAMGQRIRAIAGDVSFPVVWRYCNGKRGIDRVWRLADGELLWQE